MKTILTGGFLGLFGAIGLMTTFLIAAQNLATAWSGNRLLATVLQGEYAFLFFLSLLFFVVGTLLMLMGCFKKDT